ECEAVWELGFPDRPLRTFDVVADTPKLERPEVCVPDAVAGGRAPIPWLPDAARVDQRGALEMEGVDAVLVRHRAVGHPEDSRHVSVPMEADTAVDQLEVRLRDRGVEHVF